MRIMITVLAVMLLASSVQAADAAGKLKGAWAKEIPGGGKMVLIFDDEGMVTSELRLIGTETKKVSLRFIVNGYKIKFIKRGGEESESTFTLKGDELKLEGGIFSSSVPYKKQ